MNKKHLRKTKEYQMLASYRRRRMNEEHGYITAHDVAQAHGRVVNNYTRAIGEAFREAKEVAND